MSLNFHEEDYYDNIANFPQKRLSKRQKRQVKKENKNHLFLRNFEPKTENQEKAFDYYDDDYNLLLHGLAGTGKTFISLYLALNDILNENVVQDKVIIVRSVVPTRDMGFLPGSEKEKSKVYEAPYVNICSELFGRGDAYEVLKGKDSVQFVTTSFVRGITMDNAIVIVDEAQNLTFHELDSIITRMGEGSRIIFSGDFRQSDLRFDDERSGLKQFMRILGNIKEFESIEFEEDDIVRSRLVKSYIISKAREGVF